MIKKLLVPIGGTFSTLAPVLLGHNIVGKMHNLRYFFSHLYNLEIIKINFLIDPFIYLEEVA